MIAIALGQIQNSARNSGKLDPLTAYARMTWTAPAVLLRDGIGNIRIWATKVGRVNQVELENRRLRDKLRGLEVADAQIQVQQAEIQKLREMVDSTIPPSSRVAAKIIAFVPLENRIRLAAGANQGIQPGRPVVSGAGLVGQVSTVDKTTCDVTLLGSPTLKIAALSQKSGVVLGLIRGETRQRLTLDIEEVSESLVPGDVILTSGLTEAYPRGIVIGDVIEVKLNRDVASTRAYVSPRARIEDLTEVFILK